MHAKMAGTLHQPNPKKTMNHVTTEPHNLDNAKDDAAASPHHLPQQPSIPFVPSRGSGNHNRPHVVVSVCKERFTRGDRSARGKSTSTPSDGTKASHWTAKWMADRNPLRAFRMWMSEWACPISDDLQIILLFVLSPPMLLATVLYL